MTITSQPSYVYSSQNSNQKISEFRTCQFFKHCRGVIVPKRYQTSLHHKLLHVNLTVVWMNTICITMHSFHLWNQHKSTNITQTFLAHNIQYEEGKDKLMVYCGIVQLYADDTLSLMKLRFEMQHQELYFTQIHQKPQENRSHMLNTFFTTLYSFRK